MSMSKYQESQRKLELRWMLSVVVISFFIGVLWFSLTNKNTEIHFPSSQSYPTESQSGLKQYSPQKNVLTQKDSTPQQKENIRRTQQSKPQPELQPELQSEFKLNTQNVVNVSTELGSLHAPAKNLQNFSLELSGFMALALQNEANAVRAFSELENCALMPETIQTVRALCLLNAQRLAQKYEHELQQRYTILKSNASSGTLTASQKSLLE
jgi:hypothetical protein